MRAQHRGLARGIPAGAALAGACLAILAHAAAAREAGGGPAGDAVPDILAFPADSVASRAEARVTLSIPKGRLEEALVAFTRQTGVKLVYPTELTAGLTSPGLEGAFPPRDALARLLDGTGLTSRAAGDSTITLVNPRYVQLGAASGSTQLDEIAVEGGAGRSSSGSSGSGPRSGVPGPAGIGPERADGPVRGFVAKRSATGTKTDTPLIETPQSISVVTTDQIVTQQAQTVGEALNYVAGVAGTANTALDQRCGGLQIRGFNVTDSSFYRDSLRLPNTGSTSFNCLDPYGAERIEVLKGPPSVLYGSGTVGGIVNYVSKRPLFVPFGEVAVSGGSFDQIRGEFDVGGPVGPEGHWAYRVTGVARQSGSQVDTVINDRVFIAPALTWRPDADTELTILANYQKDWAGWGLQFLPALGTVFPNLGRIIPNNRFVGIPGLDRYDTEQASIGYVLQHSVSDNVVFRQNARFSHLNNDSVLAYGIGYVNSVTGDYGRTAGFSNSVVNSFAIDNQAQFQFATGPLFHTALVGLDYRTTTYLDSGNSFDVGPINVFDPVYTGPTSGLTRFQDIKVGQDQVGLYLQDQIKFGGFTFVLGGRSDWADTVLDNRFDSTQTRKSVQAFTGKAGAIYNFDNGIAPYFSYSESFLPPLDVSADGRLFEPETGRQYEVGVKYQPLDFNGYFTVAAFDLTRQNVVRFDRVGGTFNPRQTGEINSRGVEVEAVVSLTEGLNVRAGYAYLDAEVTKDPDGGRAGTVPILVPRNRLSAFADYTIQGGDWRGIGFGGGIRYVGSTFGDDANSFKVPEATVFDAVASYTYGNYRLAIAATNLLDERYVASCFFASFGCFYAEGRRVTARLSYRW